MGIVVQKYGGSSVADADGIKRVAQRIVNTKKQGHEVVVVVSAPAHDQRRRVLARRGMTAERFEQILARQTPDEEKRRRADFVVETGHGVETARRQVGEILALLSTPGWRSRRPDALHRLAEPGE